MDGRIYTIPARDVVPGMFLFGDLVVRVEKTARRATIYRFVDGRETPATSNYPLHADVEDVGLPGPSPREVLCICSGVVWEPRKEKPQEAEERSRALACDDWSRHKETCQVRKLRLRLWPVGAEWNGKEWLFHRAKLGEYTVVPHELVRMLHTATVGAWVAQECGVSYLCEIRHAFCEPEPTP